MPNVKSPYNFVPLNKKVFKPYWADFVSHDIPFKDQLSGSFKLKITAKTPIFVRGEEFTENNHSVYSFFKHNDKYCIPGTSIKGEIEAVLEIMSFGKLKNVNNDEKFSVRDMADRNNLMGQANKCGFLFKRDGTYVIEDCGNVLRIDYNNINRAKSVQLNGLDAQDKYNQINSRDIKVDIEQTDLPTHNGNIAVPIATFNENSISEGELVFTNNINNKNHEFVFIRNGNSFEVSDNVVEDFKLVYFGGDSILGNHWKNDFNDNKPIPIFYKSVNNTIKIGFTQLFKVLYKNSIYDLINRNFSDLLTNEMDLVDTIFGHTNNDDKMLKGRVSIEPALLVNILELNPTIITILGSPKPTFYPYYIFQNPNQNTLINGIYDTYMHDNAEIAGRKRYPIKDVEITYNPEEVENDDVMVRFKPLPINSEFETTIHYHNLRPVELGALLSAITFHNTTECHHSLGMAKPLGYGNVTFEISGIKPTDQFKYMCMFEKLMTGEINDWINTEQLKELFTMAKPIVNNNKLKYLELTEFAGIKRETKALPRYSEFIGGDFAITPTSLISDDCVFDYDKDKKSFTVNTSTLEQKTRTYLETEKTELIETLAKVDKSIDEELIIVERAIKESKKEAFQENGIDFILEQGSINSLISKTRTWQTKFYTKEEQTKIKNKQINAIPIEFVDSFMKHVQAVFETNKTDRNWKNKKDYKNSNGFKYLLKCVGEEKTVEFFKYNNLIKK